MLRNGIATKTKNCYKEKRLTCNKNFMIALKKYYTEWTLISLKIST